MLSLGRSLVFVALAVPCAGCAFAQTIHVPNPLVAGQVAQNRIHSTDYVAENMAGVPHGTVVDEASLVSLDPGKVCFDVVVRTAGARQSLARVDGWRVFLRGTPSFENKMAEVGPPAAVTATQVQGFTTVQRRRNERICDDAGNCINREITSSESVPTVVDVLTGGGPVCFANQGTITPATEEITLHLDDPQNFAHRIAFRWSFK